MVPIPNELNIEKLFRIPLKALRISQSHPNIPRNKMWILKLFMYEIPNFLSSCMMVYSAYMDLKLKDYIVASQNFLMGLVFYFINYQYLTLLTKGKPIGKLLKMIEADYAKDMPRDEREIVLRYARRAKVLCYHWLMVGMSFQVMSILKYILTALYTYYVTNEWKLLPSYYPMTYPSPIEEHKQNPVVFTLLHLLLIFYLYCNAVIISALPPLGIIFMLHACGQLEIVKRRVSVLYSINNSAEEIETMLKDIIKRLLYIYDFVHTIQEAFQLFYEMTMKATSLAVSVASYAVLVSLKSGYFSLEFIIYSGIAVVFSSYPCYYSDLLMEKGEEVRLAIYSCRWENRYDQSIRKTLTMMLLRGLQPIVIRTIFRRVCLDALTDVFREAYAIFNLLNAFY